MTLGRGTMTRLAADALSRAKTMFRVDSDFFLFQYRLARFMAGIYGPAEIYLFDKKKFVDFSFYMYTSMVSVMEEAIVANHWEKTFFPDPVVYQALLDRLNVFRQARTGSVTLNAYDLCLAQFNDGDMCLMYGPVPIHLVQLPPDLGFMTMRAITETMRSLIASHVIPRIGGLFPLVRATGETLVQGLPQAIVDYMPTFGRLTLTPDQIRNDHQVNRHNTASRLLFVASYSLMWMLWGMYKLVTTTTKPSPPQFPQHNMAAEHNDFNLTHGFTLNTDYPEPREPFPFPPLPNEPEVPITSGNIPDTIDNIIHQKSETNPNTIALVAPIVVLCALAFALSSNSSNKWMRQKKIKV